jgi:hypothetical protein
MPDDRAPPARSLARLGIVAVLGMSLAKPERLVGAVAAAVRAARARWADVGYCRLCLLCAILPVA